MMSPIPGIVTPATMGCQIVRSSWRPRKYHGAFDGFGVWLKFACSRSGARTRAEKIVTSAINVSRETNSLTSRWGQVWTLSCASARVCWIDPALTTVRSRWVWPPGPVAVEAGAAAAVAAAARPAAAGRSGGGRRGGAPFALRRPAGRGAGQKVSRDLGGGVTGGTGLRRRTLGCGRRLGGGRLGRGRLGRRSLSGLGGRRLLGRRGRPAFLARHRKPERPPALPASRQ